MFQWFWTIFSLGAPGKWLLRMVVEAEGTQESDNDTENDSQKQQVVALKRPPPFTLKVPMNIGRTLMCTGHRSWNVLNAFGTITTRFVLYAITRFPRGEITWKRAFVGVTIVEQLHTKDAKTLETNFYSPSKEENEDED